MRHILKYIFFASLTGSTISLLPVLIYPTKRTESTETSFTKFKSLPSFKMQDLSFCFWVKVNHLVGAKVINYELNDTKGFGITLQEKYGFVNLKVVDLLFDYNTPHIPAKWRHYCVVYDSTLEGVTVYIDGKVTFEKIGVTALAGSEFHDDLLEHVSVGKGGGSFSQQLNGEFSQLMVWGRAIGKEEVESVWGCDWLREGLVLDWSTVSMEMGDTIRMVEMEVKCPSQLGLETETLVGLGHRLKFAEAQTACLSLGGRQEPPLGLETVEQIKNRFGQFQEDCNSKFWVPIKQQGSRWLSVVSAPVPYIPWTPGQPNGGRHQACAEAKFDKLNGSFQGYNDLNCGKSVRCFFCYLPAYQRFTFRGMCRESNSDTMFVSTKELAQGGRPYWKGYRNSEITYSSISSSWLLRNISTGQVLATYNGTAIWPVGRVQWLVAPGVCGHWGQDRPLLLSSCLSSEFTCGDGTCLPLSSKCDGVSDCEEELDESDCRVVEFPTNRHYKETLPPVGRRAGKMIPTQVSVAVEVMSVTDIKESSMAWACKLQLNLSWVDSRVRWRDLRSNQNMNVLLQSDILPNIWVAALIFANSPNNEITIMDEKASLTVEKVGNFTIPPWDQLEEVAYFEGDENPVTYRREFKQDFSCDFQLFTYPFDTQHCTIKLQTPDRLEGLVKLKATKLVYSGAVEMLQFNVINWRIEKAERGLKVVLSLKRRYHHHLFTTFIPTFGLMIMCQSTLYLRADHFKTKSGVTLTTMLVMYTLYQSVSVTLPPTAFIKMIDIWLIFGLVMPFCVFFLLVMIDHLPSTRPDQMDVSKLSQVREVMVIFAHFVLPILILVFAVSYLITAIYIYNSH